MEDCIIWSGCKDEFGYGKVRHNGKTRRIHKLVYCQSKDIEYDDLPKGIVVRHTCDNPSCYNINHLIDGTQRDNVQDCIRRGRSRCNKGVNNPRAVLNMELAESIREDYKAGEVCRKLSTKYGVSLSTIYRVIKGVAWG